MRAAKSNGFAYFAVADPREGLGGAGPALLFGPNGGPKGKKKFFLETAPLPPPPPLSMGLYDRASALSQGLDPALFCTFLCLR